MTRTYPMLVLPVIFPRSLYAQVNDIRALFQTMLSPQGSVPTQQEFFGKVNEQTVGSLSADDLKSILPLGAQCLRSSARDVRAYGIGLLMAASLRPDSATLVGPYVGDLGPILRDPKDPLREGTLLMLTVMNPKPSARAIELLTAHLNDASNSSQASVTICAGLLQVNNDGLTTEVLASVRKRNDPFVTAGAVRTLGPDRTHNPEALTLIGKSLDSPEASIKLAAIDAANRSDRATRAQLVRIASDSSESKEIRSAAQAATESN